MNGAISLFWRVNLPLPSLLMPFDLQVLLLSGMSNRPIRALCHFVIPFIIDANGR